MSGHSFGAGPDPGRQQKTEIKLGLMSPMQNADIIKQNLQANINKGSSMSMSGVRPIAPSPGGIAQMTAHQIVSATQLLSSTGQAGIPSKIAAIGQLTGGQLTGAGDHTTQIAAVNLTNQAVSQGTGATQIRTLSTQQPLLQLQQSNALAQQNVVRLPNSVQVAPMSSIIKGQPAIHQQTQIFPAAAHLPRGAAAASQLTATKSSGVATAMLRPAQPGTGPLQIPASSGGTTVVPNALQHAPHIQPRAILPVRGPAPPSTRAESPAVQMHQGHGDGHKGAATTMPSIQISVQQRSRVEVHPRPMAQSKPATVAQSQQQPPMSGQPAHQKVLMSTQGAITPAMLQQSSAIHAPLTLPAGQKLGQGQLMSPMIRQSKVITSQPANLTNITGHNATYALSGGNRPSKIIVTQAGGTQQNLPTGIITTVAKTSLAQHTLPRQQKVLSHHVNTIATTTTVTSVTNKGVKLPAQRQPQQAAGMAPHGLAHLQQAHLSQQQQTHPFVTTAAATHALLEQAQALHVSSATHQSITHPGLVQTSSTQAANAVAAHANMILTQQQQQKTAATSLMMPAGTTSNSLVSSSGSTTDVPNRESSQERVVPLPFNIPASMNMATLAQYYNANPSMAELYQKAVLQGGRGKIQSQPQNLSSTLQGTTQGATVTVSQGAIPNQSQAAQSQQQPPQQQSGASAAVRIGAGGNPSAVMVTVDPSTRHITTLHQNTQAKPMAELIAATKTAQAAHGFKYVNKADGNLVATMASSHLSPAVAVAMGAGHVTSHPASQNVTTTTLPSNSNLTASPRPSILRKRNNEGITIVKRQILSGGGLSTNTNIISNHNLPSPASSGALLDNHIQPATTGPTGQFGVGGTRPLPHTQNLSSSQHHQLVPTSHPNLQQQTEGAMLSPKPSVELANENSQSSTDTASSTHSTPQSKALHIKQDNQLSDASNLENGHLSCVLQNNNNEASPRKKPRKQLLHANTEHEQTDVDEEIEKFSKKVHSSRLLEKQQEEEDTQAAEREVLSEFIDEEGVRWVREKKRPPIALLNHYQCSWKPKNNHFLRHSDVKPKEERRPTVNELANQKHIVQKSSGWKMYHLAAQIEELMDAEKTVLDKMIDVQDQVAPKHIAKTTMEDDIGMVHELSQGNIQRCQLFADQMQEAKTAMLKILDHKKRITEIINKHHSKRPVKKKERS